MKNSLLVLFALIVSTAAAAKEYPRGYVESMVVIQNAANAGLYGFVVSRIRRSGNSLTINGHGGQYSDIGLREDMDAAIEIEFKNSKTAKTIGESFSWPHETGLIINTNAPVTSKMRFKQNQVLFSDQDDIMGEQSKSGGGVEIDALMEWLKTHNPR